MRTVAGALIWFALVSTSQSAFAQLPIRPVPLTPFGDGQDSAARAIRPTICRASPWRKASSIRSSATSSGERCARSAARRGRTALARKAAGQPRIIPQSELPIPVLVTWQDYRTQLVAKGVRPASAATSPPDYCAAAGAVSLSAPN